MALRGDQTTAVGSGSTLRLLMAMCGPCVLAFPADWVRGILMPAEAGEAQTIVSGGIAYPVTNLAQRLGLPTTGETAETRVILYGTGACRRAFIVDQIFEMFDATRPALKPLPRHFQREERTRLSGYLLYRDTVGFVVNPLWLLESSTHGHAFGSDLDAPVHEKLTIAYAGAAASDPSSTIKQLN